MCWQLKLPILGMKKLFCHMTRTVHREKKEMDNCSGRTFQRGALDMELPLWQAWESQWHHYLRRLAYCSCHTTGNLFPGSSKTSTGTNITAFIFLVDGMYPPYSMFVNTIAEITKNNNREFWTTKEAMSKYVERAFSVLVSRSALFTKSCNSMDRALAAKITHAAIILRNMIMKARRDRYESELYKLAQVAVYRG